MSNVLSFPVPEDFVFECRECGSQTWVVHIDYTLQCTECEEVYSLVDDNDTPEGAG